MLIITRGNKDLDRLAAARCLSGSNNVPKALKDMELRFGAVWWDLVKIRRRGRVQRWT